MNSRERELTPFRFAPFIGVALLTGLLAACAWQPTADPEPASEVRAPAGGEEARGLQVYPLRNPAVAELSQAAEAAQAEGELERAHMLLERALRIEPRDPELLQHMAELQLSRGRWDQAAQYAARSFELGPRVGEICRRNWQTLALARERRDLTAAANQARERAQSCSVELPERY